MRLLKTLALGIAGAALMAAGPKDPPETALAEAEAKVAKAYAADLDKLGSWCLEKKLLTEGKHALQKAFLWDGRNQKLCKKIAGIQEEAPDAPSDEKLTAELEARRGALGEKHAKAFAKLAQQAAKAKAWGAARRYAVIARKLKEDCPGLEAVDKGLSGEGAEAVKTLDADLSQAKSGHVLRPESPELKMEYLFKLPKDHDLTLRCPLYIHVHGSGGNAKEAAGALESFRNAGFAVLAPTCHSSWNQDKRDPGVECDQILALVARFATEMGIDPERAFLDGHSGGGNIAYTMIDKHRDRLRGVIPIEANFRGAIRKPPKPDPFPVYVIKGEKDEHNAAMLDGEIAAALDTLKRGQFTNVKFEVIPEMTHSNIFLCEPQRLAWCQDVLVFKAGR